MKRTSDRSSAFGKGLVIVYTGPGKGKTSAALGMALRALGHGLKVLMVRFVKDPSDRRWPSGELKALKGFKGFTVRSFGRGFIGIGNDKQTIAEHRRAAREGLDHARRSAASGRFDLVILDELNIAADPKGAHLVGLDEIKILIKKKASKTHLIFTGRGACPWLMRSADLVTEMREVKHPFQKGCPVQPGIDY